MTEIKTAEQSGTVAAPASKGAKSKESASEAGAAGAGRDDFATRDGVGGLVGYFGYGSLVNRATLRPGIVGAHRARLKGWRRTWRPRPDMGPTPGVSLPDGVMPALLTAERATDQSMDGLLVIDVAENLGHVDAREFRYHRRDLSLEDLELPGSALQELSQTNITLHVYEARSEHPPVKAPSHILRSYLDAVMQGFLNEFGLEGVHRFVVETDAFHTPIHEDRHAPIYPRAVSLSREEIELFDAALGSRDSVLGRGLDREQGGRGN